MGTHGDQVDSLATVMPGLFEDSGVGGARLGIQRQFSVSLGPPLLVNSTVYKQALFVAPCNGCRIQELWVTAAVSIGTGTHTLAFERYDASANSGANVLSTTNVDPAGIVTAKEGAQLTLSATPANLRMDEGDVLWSTLTIGTQSPAGEGYIVTVIVLVPEIL